MLTTRFEKETNLKTYLSVLLCIVFSGYVFCIPAFAQQSGSEDAPQILTTDLIERQKAESSQLDANFVIYDDDVIKEVTINGQKIEFIEANTLSIDHQFLLKQGTNTITVEAVDKEGNKRTSRYLVAFGVELEPVGGKKADDSGGFGWKIIGNVRYNSDSNPNNDLGVPIDTGDVTIEGQIADDEQADTQTAANLLAIFNWGGLKVLGGVSQSTYAQELYESLNSQVILAGLGYEPKASEKGFLGRFMWLSINLGGEAYAQYNILTAGYQIGRHDKEDGTTRHLLGVVYNYKIFADTDLEAGNSAVFKWEYTNLDAENLDYFKSVLAYGSGNNGTENSEYSGYFMDFDWANKWESGFLQGTGFGMHYKEYPNQEPLVSGAGNNRIDVPIRFSTHLGWAFSDYWSLKFNYDYKINVSTKNPSYKTVTGVQLNGGF